MKVAFHAGEREVNVGDRFSLIMTEPDAEWEVAELPTHTTYGPSGFGGTPVFKCRLVTGQMPERWKDYRDAEGLLEFCGDSIAAAMHGSERVSNNGNDI